MSIKSYTENTFILVNKNYMHRHFFNSLEQLFSFCFLYLFVRTIKQKQITSTFSCFNFLLRNANSLRKRITD